MVLSVTLSFAVALSTASVPSSSPSHALTAAAAAGLRMDALIRAEAEVEAEVNRRAFPGAALAIGRRGQVVVERGIGRLGWGDYELAVDPDRTVYDVASLTKVVGTTTAVMLLVEDGRMSLNDPVGRYLPEWRYGWKGQATIRHLLTHTSGLPAGASLWASTPEDALTRAVNQSLLAAPGTRVEYSDIGFVVLWAAAEKAAGEPLYRLLDRRVYSPLGMRSTTFLPGEGCSLCAPTALRDDWSGLQRGRVHDPISRQLGGVAGNAGLFSTGHDLARFAAMLANRGELDGVRIFNASTVDAFTRRQHGAGSRTLGWDTAEDGATFGHTGYTGTSIWIDPVRGSWSVLLTNRTYEPRAENRIPALRRALRRWVAVATEWSSLG